MVSLQSKNLYSNIKNIKNLQRKVLNKKIDIFKQSDKQFCDFVEKRVILNIILEICEDCKKMAALPQGAFMACKLRDQYRDKDLIVSRIKTGGDKNESKYFNGNKKLMEYSPVKYNEKLMKSIWGFYNRYSPHNIKSNEIASHDHSYYQQQQQSAVAYPAIAHNLAMAVTTGKEWSFMEKK